MDAMAFEVGGVLVCSPVSAGTNAILAVQCAVSYALLRDPTARRSSPWRPFFLFLGLATAAGVLKHGLSHYAGSSAYAAVLLTSDLNAGLSTFFAQRAALASWDGGAGRLRWLAASFRAKLLVFVLLAVGLRHFLVVVADTAVGLSLALALEVAAWRGRAAGSGWISVGLGAGFLPAAAYLLRLSVGPWLDHVDVAHVLMMPSLALVLRGARALPGGRAGWKGERP